MTSFGKLGRGLVLLGAAAAVAAAAWAAAQQLSVQVKETQIRAKASFLGASVATLGYGARVTVVEDKGAWVRVRDDKGKEGWVHRSALTEKKVKLSSGGKDAATGAGTDELALAGKGFSAEVEDAFKEQNAQLDFTWVDRMESWVVSPDDARRFLAAGEVTSPEVQP
jgi:uncharacterized protein YgiM (DUF1202 family)